MSESEPSSGELPRPRRPADDERVDLQFAEDVCRQWNLSFGTIVESINDGVLVCDLEGRIAYVNPSLAEMLGYEPRDAIGRTIYDFMGEDWADRAARRLERRRQGVEEIFDHQLCHRDGSVVWGAVSAKPLEDDDGEIIGSLVAIRDITERKRTEDQLRKMRRQAEAANEAKSEFLANMSHEIRTPLNGILEILDILDDRFREPDERKYLQMGRQAARGLLQLIDDILDLSKIEAREVELEIVEFDPADLVTKTLQTLTRQAATKGLELVYEQHPEIPDRICGDPARVRQIAINLVKNSIKFTDEGEVVVTLDLEERTDDEVVLRLEVADTGRGIPKEKQNQIFEPFRQEGRNLRRPQKGTGLGLSIGIRLVELMEGEIWLDSTPGEGTTVYVSIPFEVTEWTDETLQRRGAPLEGRTLVVAADDHRRRRYLETVLGRWNVEASVVEDGASAMEAVETEGPDAVIVDRALPEMTAEKLAEGVRETGEGEGLPVLVLATDGELQERGRIEELGIAAQLTTPVDPEALLGALGEVLGLEKLRESKEDQKAPEPRADLRVLLAEDDPVNREATKGLLEKEGHDVVVAEDGARAVRAFKKEDEFDLILMDLQMPEMDGYEATEQIRALEEKTDRSVPIMALTAHAMRGECDRVLEAGMDDYLAKPVGVRELSEAIDRVVRP